MKNKKGINKKKILIVIGPRPEVIKLAPLFLELKKYKEFKTEILLTGQHRQLVDQTMKAFDLRADYDLNVMKKNQTLEELSSKILLKFSDFLRKIKPDIVIAEGDTTTTVICAICCYYQKIPFGHVEAGLRSYDKFQPFPEEINRKIADVVADFYFAPTVLAKNNLLKEGLPKERIFVTGNTVIDSLHLLSRKKHNFKEKKLRSLSNKPIVLVTIHRRESFGKPLKEAFQALKKLSNENVQIVYPVHPNPNVKNLAYKMLSKHKNIILTKPLSYLDFINMMKKSYFILTDSGGVQEEAPTFRKPVLVLRNITERPEGVKAGVSRVVGTDMEKILKYSKLLIHDKNFYLKMCKKKNIYGDGRASERIAKVIKKWLDSFPPIIK